MSEAEKTLEMAEHHRDAVKEATRGIAEDYHPYDLETGKEKTAEEVATSLGKLAARDGFRDHGLRSLPLLHLSISTHFQGRD